ncbi:hypothetical protein CONCODRAFT_74445 [Conidiobolus coronatus NRRL 28638]|uniref:RRM domain-containing protein n=1 Tax=Conidiobolus coronatus (strain ATCC 28846 / CBS 209.66 / NRRL 28638) TaxID=796925 RepID=A0A137NR09_CONC2|nr:hypothetical protein CONCODRAFT_74445 [Conidiobolus coronatus NRRL 28638]|eukprot:KXN65152.1 hypothetical protein CONCODRAFT_74445 [Conidiobolus coronatus NRRL 28638]
MTEVAQVPSSSNLPNTEDLPTEKRLYIGGLSSQLTSTEIEEKFSRFGKITKNLEISQKFQILSTLNGSNWKGSKLKIQEAKPSNFERITNERVNVDSSDDKDKKIRKRIMFEHSKDFNLVNVDNYEANTVII